MLLHFTQNFSILESILETSFLQLGYCTEYFGHKDKVISSSAHPMVCFSEYEDFELEAKEITYGGYAIGLSKCWAVEKGLSPVQYVEKNSQAAIGLSKLLEARQKNGKDTIPKRLRLPIMQIKCFTKHETGHNSYFNEDNFCFKSENEWRYVPTKNQIGGGYISLNKNTFLKKKDFYNNKLKPYPLKFEANDVIALYVQTEKQKSLLSKKYPHLTNVIDLAKWKVAAKV